MAIDKLFQNLMGSASANGALGGAASGALVSMLMNKKSRKKLGSTALNVGGLAAVAGLGYYAYQKWQSGRQTDSSEHQAQAGRSVPADIEAASRAVRVDETLGVKLVFAMIAAAAADGKIDNEEMGGLLDSIESADLPPDENSKLTAALNQPPSVEDIQALAESPEQASELYAASLAAIDLDTPAEDLYLRRLARSLKLEPSLVKQLHSEASALPE